MIVDPEIDRIAKRFKPRPGVSQHGEHVWIDAVIGPKRRGYAVDVGACDGLSLSNTLHLERRGWDVLCIEPNPYYHKDLARNRKLSLQVACGARNVDGRNFTVYEVGQGNYEAYSALNPDHNLARAALAKKRRMYKVNVRTLDICLEKVGFPRLDVVSIDVEGGEPAVLAGFDIDRWRPKIVVIEDWRGPRLRSWFCRHGYYALKRLGPNELFVRANDE